MPRPPTTTRDEVLNENRRKLLEMAAVEFADKGFAGANINHISVAAGFAKGTIYNYFPSKRDLMLALIDEIASQHTQFIRERVESEEQAALRLKRFFSAGFDFVEQQPALAQVAISVVYGYDAGFKERIYRAYEGLFDLIIEDIIAAGVSQGAFKACDEDLAAALLMSLYLGSTSQLDSTGKILFDSEQVVAFVMGGIGGRDGLAVQ